MKHGVRPRVLQIGKFYPPDRGGMETHLAVLCEQLRHDYDIQVAVSGHGWRTTAEVRAGIPVTRLARPFSITSAPVNLGLPAVIRAARPDLVHLHLPHPGAVLGLLAAGYRGPLVVTYHSDVVRQRLMSAVFRPLMNSVLARATTIIVSSQAYADSSPVLAPHRHRCRVVPFGIDPTEPASDDAAVRRIRAEYGPRLVLGVGRLVYYKGFEVLIEALRLVDGRLLLIGDGPLRGTLAAQITRDGLGGRVKLLGSVADVAPYFAAADVFALPSIARSEAFGIVQLEAMASGTPVVNTLLDTGVPWVSRDGETGFSVPPRDAGALAAAISRLLADDHLRAQMGAAGQRRVKSEFLLSLMISRIQSIYEATLSRVPGAVCA